MTGKPVSEIVVSEWKKLYYALDAAERIQNTYDISCEAQELVASHGKKSVQSALRKTVNGDRSSAARLAKVHAIPKKMIEKAVRHVKEAHEKREEHGNSTDSDRAGRRGQDGDWAKRSDGFSQTHLLILASSENKKERNKLFYRSLDEGWGSTHLQREIKKLTVLPVTRPSHTAYSIELRAKALAELLADINEENLMQAVAKIKLADLATAAQQFETASQEIANVAYFLVGKAALFTQIASAISKRKTSESV